MKPVIVIIAVVIMVTVILYYAFNDATHVPSAVAAQSAAISKSEDAPVVLVKTIALRRGHIEKTLKSYGTVVPRTDQIRSFSVPFECVIEKVYVNAGQQLDAKQLLLTIAPSPDTRLQLERARIDAQAARQQESFIQERLDLKLATRQDLVAAHQLVEQANQQLRSLTRRGVDTISEIRADAAALVFLINVSQGQIVTAGTNLLQTIPQDQLIVSLAIEPEDLQELKEGQQVRMRAVHVPGAALLTGQIERLTRALDPQTRLVNVLVKLGKPAELLLNDYIQAEIVIHSKETLLAPRQALLPDGNGYSLFTVQNGVASKHRVEKGLENAVDVEVMTNTLQQDARIVISGNYALKNGSRVREELTR
jgi:RND family efflux transporter MFP subunit